MQSAVGMAVPAPKATVSVPAILQLRTPLLKVFHIIRVGRKGAKRFWEFAAGSNMMVVAMLVVQVGMAFHFLWRDRTIKLSFA